jgi:DNA-directed RNA polymerase specialized sigma24 family protein
LKEVTTEFLQHRHALMGFITGLLRDSDVAEDIFQEVWVRLASAVEKGIVIEDQARWCRGTARNLVLHHWRDQRNEKVIANSSLLEKIELAFEEDDRAASNWSMLTLRYEGSNSVESVASILNKTSTSIMKALSRIRQGLFSCVERRLKTCP